MDPQELQQLQATVESHASRFLGVAIPQELRAAIIFCYERYIYRTLASIMQRNEAHSCKIDALIAFTADVWQLIHGKAVCYTAIPDNPLIDTTLCELAEKLAFVKKVSPISILMPTVVTQHLTDPTKNLDRLSLRQVIRTHLASDSGTYLLPIHSILELGPATDTRTIVNPYYDFEVHAHLGCYLSPADIEKMVRFSVESQKIFAAQQTAQELSSQHRDLLYHLKLLRESLQQNSVHGIGAENQAGELIYSKISHFFEYYDQLLSQEDKEKIPQKVAEEIQALRFFCAPGYVNRDGKKKFISNVDRMGSCIGERAKNLEALLNTYQSKLASIGVSESCMQRLLEQACGEYETAKQEFARAVYENRCRRLPAFNITNTLIQRISLPVSFSSHLEAFQTMSPDDMRVIFTLPNIPDQVVVHLSSIDKLIVLLHALSVERMIVFLDGVQPRLEYLIHNTQECFAALTTFDDTQRFSVMLTCLIQKFNVFHFDFDYLVLNLTSAQRGVFLGFLPQMIPAAQKGCLPYKTFGELLRVHNLTEVEFDDIWRLKPILEESVLLQQCGQKFETCAKNALLFSENSTRFILDRIHTQKIALNDVLVSLARSLSEILTTISKAKVFFEPSKNLGHLDFLVKLIIENKKFSSYYQPSFFFLCCNYLEAREDQEAILYLALKIIDCHYCGEKKAVLEKLLHSPTGSLFHEIDQIISIGHGLGYGRLNAALSLLVTQISRSRIRMNMAPILEALECKPLLLCA